MNKLHGAIVLVVWGSVFLAIADHAHGQSRRWRVRARGPSHLLPLPNARGARRFTRSPGIATRRLRRTTTPNTRVPSTLGTSMTFPPSTARVPCGERPGNRTIPLLPSIDEC